MNTERVKRIMTLTVGLLLVFTGTVWAGKGLVRDAYPAEYYAIPRLLEGDALDHNPTFIVYGDNRPGWRIKESFYRKKNWWTWKQLIIPIYQVYWLGNGVVGSVNGIRYKPDYGHRQARRVRDAVYAEAQRSKVDFIMNTGDITSDGRYPDHWKTFIDQNKIEVPLVLDFAYLPVIGNHEEANDTLYGMQNYRDVFSYDAFYVLRCPDVDFFVVDSSIIIDKSQYIDDDLQDELFETWFVAGKNAPEPAWLERELEASDKTFKIVAIHHPLIGFGKHYHNWTDPKSGRDLLDKRHRLLEVLAQSGVQIVLNGHEHMYEHTILKRIGDEDLRTEIHCVVTGGGGSPLHPGLDRDEIADLEKAYLEGGLAVVSARQDVVYNYCLVEVKSDEISIVVYEVPDKSDTAPELLDRVVITKQAQ